MGFRGRNDRPGEVSEFSGKPLHRSLKAPVLQLQPRKGLRRKFRFYDDGCDVVAEDRSDRIQQAQERCGETSQCERQLVAPHLQLRPRNARAVVEAEVVRSERCGTVDGLPDLRGGKAIDPVGDGGIPPSGAMQTIVRHRREFVGLPDAQLLANAGHQTVGRFEENNRPPGHAVHLKESAMGRCAVVQTRVHNDGIERSIGVGKVLGIDDLVTADVRDLEVRKTSLAKRGLVFGSAAHNQNPVVRAQGAGLPGRLQDLDVERVAVDVCHEKFEGGLKNWFSGESRSEAQGSPDGTFDLVETHEGGEKDRASRPTESALG